RAASVSKNGRPEIWICRRSFGGGPTIVGSGDAIVDLFPGTLTDIVDKHPPCVWLKREGERVTQSHGPDGPVKSGSCIEKGIVGWDGAVRIDAEHFAQTVG